MTDRGILFVKEYVRDNIVRDELDSSERLDPYGSEENWKVNMEKKYPNSSKIPIVKYRENEDGTKEKVQTGLVQLELESTIKTDVMCNEYVGKRVVDYTVHRDDSSENSN